MKQITICLVAMVGTLLILGGCASLQFENYSSENRTPRFEETLQPGEKVTYEPGNGVAAYSEGVLHLKDATYPNKEDADYHQDPWVHLDIPIRRQTLVQVDVRLSSEQGGGGSHVNLFNDLETGQRVSFILRDDSIHYFVEGGANNTLYTDFSDNTGLSLEKWNSVTFLIENDEILLFLDGSKRSTFDQYEVM